MQSVLSIVEGGDLGDIFELSKSLCSGDRIVWMLRVHNVLALLEDRLRDAVIVGSGAPIELLEPSRSTAAQEWARRLWPTGVSRLVTALEDARDQLAFNATGRVVMDALLARFAAELSA